MYENYQYSQKDDNLLTQYCQIKNALTLAIFFKNKKLLRIQLQPETILKLNCMLVLFLIITSTLGQLYRYIGAGERHYQLVNLFYLSEEKNIPTAYSSLALLFCSWLLFIIAKHKIKKAQPYCFNWAFLSMLFLLMAIDESLTLHENLTAVMENFMNPDGFFYRAWIIPATIFLVIFVCGNLKFIKSLSPKTRFLFVFAGIVFVSGAIGMEMIGGKVFLILDKSIDNLLYSAIATVEETLEMMGIVFFIYALLDYIRNYCNFQKQERNLSISFF